MVTDIIQKALVINNDGDILLVKRSDTDTRRPNMWDFPGGMLDPGEPLESGVLREIMEETGLAATDPEIFFTKTMITSWSKDGVEYQSNVLKLYYAVHINSIGVTLSFEHSEYCWVSLDEAYEMLEYVQHKEVIKHAMDNQLEL